MTKKFFLTLLITAMICAPASLSAQVTIGSGAEPSEWSLLYLDATELPKALHLPRLNYNDRDALVPPVSVSEPRREPERGLMIFNTDNFCLEYWNGERWVSLCVGGGRSCPPQFGIMAHGVCWARYNVDLSTASGFTENQTAPGMLFQWNRNVGWSVPPQQLQRWNSDTNSWENASWDTSYEAGTVWVNDPCPRGWRVPTLAEFQTLGNGFTPINVPATGGRLLGAFDGYDGVFFPFLNFRRGDSAPAIGSTHGRYWSSTPFGNISAWSLRIAGNGAVIGNGALQAPGLNYRMEAYAVRCVFPLD